MRTKTKTVDTPEDTFWLRSRYDSAMIRTSNALQALNLYEPRKAYRILRRALDDVKLIIDCDRNEPKPKR